MAPLNAPGRSFGRYTLLEKLGEGGMGAVYRARDERLGRLVALKVVRSTGDGAAPPTPEAAARLMREARAAAALTHPHVVAIYDVSEHEGVPCIAMELVEGPSLRRLLGGDAPLGLRLDWLRQVADALRAAHELGIVHRDIKPDNVVIRDGRHAKVLDFGLARSAETEPEGATPSEAPDLERITRESGVLGTPAYMAPEQIRGDRVDARCDQFAWGVMSFEVLAGALPWRDGLTSLGLLAAVLADAPPPLTERGVPAAIARVVSRAMAKSADDRFSSMSELIRALDEATGTTRASAPAPSVSVAPDDIARADTEIAPAKLVAAAENDAAGVLPPSAARTAAQGATTHAVARAPHSRSRVLTLAVLAALAVALASLGALGRLRWPLHAEPVSTASAQPIAPPAPHARTLENEPPPTSTDNVEALALYRRARLLQRECDWTRAHPLFEKAVALDPRFGEAQLQLAISRWISVNGFGVDTAAREAYARAVDERPRMSERDRAMVEAHEPILAREPPDWPAAILTMGRLAKARPNDAEIRLRYATLRGVSGDYDIEDDVTAACEIDPAYADAWQMRMYVEVAADRPDAAAEAAAECHRIAPNSKECAWTATAIYAFIGHCEDAEREARRSAGNDIAQTYGTLLLGLGRPRDAVDKAFELGWSTAPDLRPQFEPLDRFSVAMADGDMTRGKVLARQLLEASRAGSSRTEAFHWAALTSLATAAHEDSTLKAEEALLREELRRRKEWEGDAPFYKNGALTVWSHLRRNGLATATEVSTARAELLTRYAGVFEKHPTLSWATECQAAETPEEARAAVDHQPATIRPGELINNQEGRAHIGIALLRAGEVARSTPCSSRRHRRASRGARPTRMSMHIGTSARRSRPRAAKTRRARRTASSPSTGGARSLGP